MLLAFKPRGIKLLYSRTLRTKLKMILSLLKIIITNCAPISIDNVHGEIYSQCQLSIYCYCDKILFIFVRIQKLANIPSSRSL